MSIAQSNEHLRVGSENAFKARLSENYNPTREHLDFEIKEGGVITALNKDDSITARIKRNLKSHWQALRSPRTFVQSVLSI